MSRLGLAHFVFRRQISAMTNNSSPPLSPRLLGAVNWLGLWTLTSKEIRRFFKVYVQTILAPVATTLIFLAVFVVAMQGAPRAVEGLPFALFLSPGLIMMAITQNAFANSSSSLVIAKVQGNIVDVLMPPLSAWELTAAYTLGGVVRGLVVGLVVGLSMLPFIALSIHNIAALLYYALMASMTLSLLGVIGGVWSEKFEHMAAMTNFVITPLSFLSGTFYSIVNLPESLRMVASLNPFFYMIDGFRYGMTGHADGDLFVGAIVLFVLNVALASLAWTMFHTGYKLKS